MNISLTPELKKFVQEQVSGGMYYSASEVVRQGLRMLKEQEALKSIRLEELKKEIAVGITQADQERFVDGETTFNNIKEKSRQRRQSQA
jgi:antitoxin ParD1/3/4